MKHEYCPTGMMLLDNGECDCKEGYMLNSSMECVLKHDYCPPGREVIRSENPRNENEKERNEVRANETDNNSFIF